MQLLVLLLICAFTRTSSQQMEMVHGIPTRCSCIQLYSSIPLRRIRDFTVTLPTSHCKFTEVIVFLKNSSALCLKPAEKQGKKLIRCWKRNPNNTDKRKRCVKRRSTRRKDPRPAKKRGKRATSCIMPISLRTAR
ncbi:growth-regulated protein homolog gamma-like [Spea bombifrons]|uniref:growth-regulated protein homolog gamma-like n=1 Tax=Spea bombifrons TaxID=233779 RepID=UPI002348F1D9|nr:growth-regulated protein homolog gamma-like [Spea bombifrons]